MSRRPLDGFDRAPVYVIGAIPASGEHGVTPEQIERDVIPTPKHLRVFAELGRGGMGRIYTATDRNLIRHVALKCLDQSLAREPTYRDAFIAEAQIAGQLEHPNIVPVHELSIDARGAAYFTMRLVQGSSLHDWLHHPDHPLGSSARLEDGLEILVKVCDATAYAHHRGVVHRDIKPANIMVESFGQVYLMDWGLARLTRTPPVSGQLRHLEAQGHAGTPAYMAPEQARGNTREMDERTDVFGLGAVLYEILSGKGPYGNDPNDELLLERARNGAVVPIDAVTAGLGLSKSILAIADKATHPNRTERYQSVLDLQLDIKNFLRQGLHLPQQSFDKGSVIIREGDLGSAAYVIIEGTCRAYRIVGSQEETLAIMGPGEVFGEMALLLEGQRAASVRAITPVTVLVLDKLTLTEGLGIGGWTGALVSALAQRFLDLELKVRRSGMPRP
jgi:eukaryotic-like serine/threonine-protein kinase